MLTRLVTPHCQFELLRYPSQADDPLQAWDAADEYLINTLADEGVPEGGVIVMNDGFGALTAYLHPHQPYFVSDSFISRRGAEENLRRNGLDGAAVTWLDALAPLPSTPALVVIKVSKYQALLEHQLIALAQVVTPQTRILAAGKAKEIHTSTLQLFEKWLGVTTTSLAWKKARLIHCTPRSQPLDAPSPYPTIWPLEGTTMVIRNHANVFSRTSLDIGARFMLEHLPLMSAPGR